MNLDYAKPFSNTSDLKNMTPTIHADLAESRAVADREKKYKGAFIKDNKEIKLEEDPLSKLISNAREALGKEASKSDIQEEA